MLQMSAPILEDQLTQQVPSPLIQGADTVEAVERQIEATLKVDIPDVAATLRAIALSLPGFPSAGPSPTPTPVPTPTPTPVPTPSKAQFIVVGSPVVS